MKKIIFSTYDDIKNPYYGGGGALVFHEVARRLAKKYLVCVYTGSYPGAKNEVIDRVIYKRVGPKWVGPFLGQLSFHLFLLPYVIKEKYIVWFESFTPPWSASILPIFTRKPVVGVTQFFDADAKAKQYKIPFQYIERLNIQLYKYVIALTDHINSKLLSLNPRLKTFIIPNGVTIPRILNQVSHEKPYILFVGRLEINQKGIDLLLAAFAKASKLINDKLYIAGSGQDKDITYINNRIQSLGIENRVTLYGKVKGKVKDTLFSQAKYVIIPSRYESLCIVGLEALAYGKPVLCFDIPGLRWMSSLVAQKVKPFSETLLYKEILHLSGNRKLRKRMSNNAVHLVRQYNWNSVSEKYIEVIHHITQT